MLIRVPHATLRVSQKLVAQSKNSRRGCLRTITENGEFSTRSTCKARADPCGNGFRPYLPVLGCSTSTIARCFVLPLDDLCLYGYEDECTRFLHVSIEREQVFLLYYLRDEQVAHGKECQDNQGEDHLHIGQRGETESAQD